MYRTITHGKTHRNAEVVRGLMQQLQGFQQNIQEGSAPHMEMLQNICLNVLRANVEVIEVQQKLLQQIISNLEVSFATGMPPQGAAAGAKAAAARKPEKVKVK